ncbi:hypothetical protein Vafri_10883 [Volvox africanus]|uniref:Hflx-type G domain-containing protein n=1 Tax=Volvox africanus TaxID=51714 RepID=A0A8J4B6V6_9CHLO|nr:hypothetical protein Vafri_10883 [Volvox africanus]
MWPSVTALGPLGRVRFAPAHRHHVRKQERLILSSKSSTPHIPSRVAKCACRVSEESALEQSFESALLQAQQQAGPRQRTPGRKIELPPVDERERVFLVGASIKGEQRRYSYDVHESVEELGRLAETAGLRVMGSTFQILEAPNMSTYIGSGKVAEVGRAVAALDVETVIFDDELSPGQLRNLERQLAASAGGGEGSVRVCDRTALILDIFSQRAQTREGQLQVELAQTEYQLPRLTKMWTHLDRVGGGGQVKGAGEKQIEIDKRLLRDRAAALRRELEAVRTHRRQYRDKRSATPIPVIGICGYTNAGKSTLLNTLTNAGVLAEDQLFATLDPTTRRLRLKGNKEILMSDTVGFIQKLPTELVAAFRCAVYPCYVSVCLSVCLSVCWFVCVHLSVGRTIGASVSVGRLLVNQLRQIDSGPVTTNH